VSKSKRPSITGDWPIFRLLQEYPEARTVLEQHGMSCGDCMAAMDESIVEGARMHGIDSALLLSDLIRLTGE